MSVTWSFGFPFGVMSSISPNGCMYVITCFVKRIDVANTSEDVKQRRCSVVSCVVEGNPVRRKMHKPYQKNDLPGNTKASFERITQRSSVDLACAAVTLLPNKATFRIPVRPGSNPQWGSPWTD
jgi:hypothetical protein